jgi:hypothetical protein
MIDGFFRMVFTRTAGSGFSLLVFRGGNIAGADVAGAIYDRTYRENLETGEISVQVIMTAPAGITPVQTGIPLAESAALPINTTLTQEEIVIEKAILLDTPLGPVNVIFKKIRSFP